MDCLVSILSKGLYGFYQTAFLTGHALRRSQEAQIRDSLPQTGPVQSPDGTRRVTRRVGSQTRERQGQGQGQGAGGWRRVWLRSRDWFCSSSFHSFHPSNLISAFCFLFSAFVRLPSSTVNYIHTKVLPTFLHSPPSLIPPSAIQPRQAFSQRLPGEPAHVRHPFRPLSPSFKHLTQM